MLCLDQVNTCPDESIFQKPATGSSVFLFCQQPSSAVSLLHQLRLLRDVFNCQRNVDCDAKGQPTSVLMFPNVVRKGDF